MADPGPPPPRIPSLAIVPAGLALLIALAAWPVLRAGYPTLGDGLIHYYRLVEFDHLLRQGAWFPRWAADLGYGYGLPVFNYYPPLTYYLGALFHALGLSFAHSLQAVYLLAWTLAITGAYALARTRSTSSAALLAAAAYGFAPYLYFNALARGALPETFGLGLLPWVLWGMQRMKDTGRLLIPAILLAVLALTHLLTSAMALPLAALFALAPRRLPAPSPPPPVPGILRFLAACLIGFGLAAYFLLPAILETAYIQVQRLTGPSDLDFRNNFLALSELLAWPRPFDPRLVFHVLPPSLSLAALALALLGLLGAVWHGPRLTRWDAALWAALAACALFTLPITQPVWEWLPLAAVVQFPWRLVGPASLLLALLTGGLARVPPFLERPESAGMGARGLGLPVALAALWLFSLAWTFAPAFAAPPAPPTAAGLAEYERLTGQLGTTATGEFLPVTVHALPPADALAAAYAQADVIQRLSAPPPGVSVLRQSASVLSAEAAVTVLAPVVLTFDLLHFPGWRATVDGQPVPITPSDPHGFITVPVPAGEHTVRVRFGPTPLRSAATVISLLSLGVVVAFTGIALARPRKQAAASRPTPSPIAAPPSRLVPLALLTLLLFRLALIDGRTTVFARTRFDGAAVAGVDAPLDVNFDDQLVLLGYDAPALTLPADDELSLTLYWRAQNVPAVDYSTTVQVLDADGNIWGQADSQHPGRLPTSRWRTDQYAADTHRLHLLAHAPPGDYELFVGAYQVDGPALSVLDADRIPRGQLYRLGTLVVTERRGEQQLPFGDSIPMFHNLGPLNVTETGIQSVEVQAGSEATFDVHWAAKAVARPAILARWEMLGANGWSLAVLNAPPAHTGWPTSDWPDGEWVRGIYRLRVPANAPAGPATVQVSLLDAATGALLGGPATVATLIITVPERTFDIPPMDQRVDAPIGDGVVLLGYDLDPAAGTLTLYWQPAALLADSHTAFVHALAPDGALLAQSDQLPAAGLRPTTGWLPGEIIADAHTLPLAGAASLRAGLYHPRTGARLGDALLPLP